MTLKQFHSFVAEPPVEVSVAEEECRTSVVDVLASDEEAEENEEDWEQGIESQVLYSVELLILNSIRIYVNPYFCIGKVLIFPFVICVFSEYAFFTKSARSSCGQG